ncbi:MAG: outer membrane protein [Rubricella sp.]
MTRFLTTAAVAALLAAPASAQDWTGFNVGISLGTADAETNVTDVEGDGETYGFHAGYDYDFGQFVAGGELEYNEADIDLGPGGSVDNIFRLKVRGGYDLGPAMIYGVGGYVMAETSDLGDPEGTFYGVGIDYRVAPQFTVGAEYLIHRLDSFDVSGAEADVNTFAVRAGFRF